MAKVAIITGMPPSTPDPVADSFERVQDEIDRAQWTGRGPHYTLGGGGNEPSSEHDVEINPKGEWR